MDNKKIKYPFLVTYYATTFDGLSCPESSHPSIAVVMATDIDTAEEEAEDYLDRHYGNGALISGVRAFPFTENTILLGERDDVRVMNNYLGFIGLEDFS